MPWMYILRCADNTYYVGSTTDLERRVVEHNEGIDAQYSAAQAGGVGVQRRIS